MKRLLIIGLVLSVAVYGLFLRKPVVRADQNCDSNNPNYEQCLNQNISEYTAKINDLQGQEKTLADAITVLDSRIKLTQTQIQRTQAQIDELEKEINDLGVRIDGLETSLQQLTQVLIVRVQDEYKQKTEDPMLLLLTSSGFTDFFAKYKYRQLSQEYTQRVINAAETQKVEYGNEKQAKMTKQAQVEALKKQLVAQQSSLTDESAQKTSLLQVTHNDEKKYQTLLQEAQAQLSAFKGFVNSSGGSSLLSNQTSCDSWGCYYNQRDTQWGTHQLGSSSEVMSEVGCLVTSMAMVATHYGKTLTPGDIAGSTAPFFGSTAYMINGSWNVNGVTMTRNAIGYGVSAIDGQLNAGHPVIVGLFSNSNPSHFIVIKGKDSGGYIMNDPYLENGHDKHLTDKYSNSDVGPVDSVTVN
jgi:peptidoglycan hydrolase CwlO-like protein